MCGAHQYLPLRPVPIIACWSTVMMRQTGPGNYNSIILLEKIRRSSGHQVHILVPVTNVARAIQMSWQASLSCVTMWQLSWPRLQLLSSPLAACLLSTEAAQSLSLAGAGREQTGPLGPELQIPLAALHSASFPKNLPGEHSCVLIVHCLPIAQ